MNRTHLSLYYLMSYLLLGGVGLMFFPAMALKLTAATGEYGEVMPRLVGMLMTGLAIIVAAIIKLKLEVFYPVTLLVRLFFVVGLVSLFLYSRDPFFLVILGVVGLGVAITGVSYLSERGKARAG